MPNDDTSVQANGPPPVAELSRTSPRGGWTEVFTLPRPLRELFSKFPLATYPANQLPSRSPEHQGKHALYVFSTLEAIEQGEASFNPTCLKWQTYMKLRDVDFISIASNNHASPTGSLPFILPTAPLSQTGKTGAAPIPVPSNKIRRWVDDQTQQAAPEQTSDNLREDIHLSLLDHRLRRAWLYQLYLHPSNEHLLRRLYCSHSASALVAHATLWSLRAAATEEIGKSNATAQVTEETLLREGGEALDALDELLGKEQWFFGRATPGVFDAAVFAYTHLLLDEDMDWGWNPLGGRLKGRRGLVGHRRKVWKRSFGR